MMILTVCVAVILAVLALVHVLWAFGVWVPIRDEAELARTVVGARGVTRMPGPIPSGMVAVGLGFLAMVLWMPSGLMHDLFLSVSAVVFLGRGVLAYVPLWRRMTPEQPFATLDRTRYGPLCIGLGVALVLIVVVGN